MLEIGLTGGIGSGKSTVAEMLVVRGAHLIDADRIVRELQEPGAPVFVAMVDRFGAEIVQEDGGLNRQAVADIVFADADELAALNAIVHPAVRDEMTKRRQALADTDATVILDIPLLNKTMHTGLGGIVVVDCPTDVAVERLIMFRSFTREDAEARIASQITRDERISDADFVIDNGNDLEALVSEIDRCWAWIGSLERPAPGQTVEPFGG